MSRGRILEKGDFIIITDQRHKYYLTIGEVEYVMHNNDGDVEGYYVKYNVPDIENFDRVIFNYSLPDMCRKLVVE